jgi:hypothetical protein
MPERPKSAAASIYPHLPSSERPEADWVRGVKQPEPVPKRRTAEEVRDFWANVGPAWARSIGLVRK